MVPQRFDKIESAPGNGRVSEASTHNIWYTGARLPRPTPAVVPRAGGTPREEGAARGRRRLSTRLARRTGSLADSELRWHDLIYHLCRRFGSSHDMRWALNEQRDLSTGKPKPVLPSFHVAGRSPPFAAPRGCSSRRGGEKNLEMDTLG